MSLKVCYQRHAIRYDILYAYSVEDKFAENKIPNKYFPTVFDLSTVFLNSNWDQEFFDAMTEQQKFFNFIISWERQLNSENHSNWKQIPCNICLMHT